MISIYEITESFFLKKIILFLTEKVIVQYNSIFEQLSADSFFFNFSVHHLCLTASFNRERETEIYDCPAAYLHSLVADLDDQNGVIGFRRVGRFVSRRIASRRFASSTHDATGWIDQRT